MAIYLHHLPKSQNVPILLSAPHCGQEFPADFLAQSPLSKDQLLATGDLWTDELVKFEDLAWIAARYARSVVDLNRSAQMLDFRLIDGAKRVNSPYVDAGYGVIPRFAARGHLVRNGRMSLEESQFWLDEYYHPYHAKLSAMIEGLRARFGYALVLDIHTAPDRIMGGSKIVLGNNFGTSMGRGFFDPVLGIFEECFDKVSVNQPFSGGFITQNYGQKHRHIYVLQVEIARGLVEASERKFNQEFLNIWRVVIGKIKLWLEDEQYAKLACE